MFLFGGELSAKGIELCPRVLEGNPERVLLANHVRQLGAKCVRNLARFGREMFEARIRFGGGGLGEPLHELVDVAFDVRGGSCRLESPGRLVEGGAQRSHPLERGV